MLIVTGGIRGTPLYSLLTECGELPLYLRREESLLKYLVKLNLNPSNSAKEILENIPFYNMGIKTRSEYKDILDLFYSSMGNQPELKSNYYVSSQLKDVNLDLHFNFLKAQIVNNLAESSVNIRNYLACQYPDKTYVFVDGAKTMDDRQAVAIYIPNCNITKSFRTSDGPHPYTAEAIAILEAIQIIKTTDIKNPLIMSDALCVLKDILYNTSKVRPKLIRELHNEISSFGTNLQLLWLPSHCNFAPHDVVDQLAKNALASEVTYKVTPELPQVLCAIKPFIMSKWEKDWSTNKTGAPYKSCFSFNKVGFDTHMKVRRKEILIGRMRLQCTRLNAHLCKLGIHDTGLCDVCSCQETVEHFLLHCTKTRKLRQKIKNSMKNQNDYNMKYILSNTESQDKIYEFCVENNIKI